jgi:Holliday junction resolvase RusA-like endonuclease
MKDLIFTIMGPPIPQARPRFSRYGHVYNPTATEQEATAYELRAQYNNQPPITYPISLDILYCMLIPQKQVRALTGPGPHPTTPHSKKPDIDNLLKMTLDALVKSHIIRDDNLIAKIIARKIYSTMPRTEIFITRFKED